MTLQQKDSDHRTANPVATHAPGYPNKPIPPLQPFLDTILPDKDHIPPCDSERMLPLSSIGCFPILNDAAEMGPATFLRSAASMARRERTVLWFRDFLNTTAPIFLRLKWQFPSLVYLSVWWLGSRSIRSLATYILRRIVPCNIRSYTKPPS